MKLFKLPKELLLLKIIFTIITIIIWIIFISIMYSIGVPGKFEVQPPEGDDISWEKEGDFLVMDTEFGIVNKGYWDITDLELNIDIRNQTDYYLLNYKQIVDVIPHGGETQIPINIQFNLMEHYDKSGDDWIVNDQDLKIEIQAKTKYAKRLISFVTNFTQESQWGAPLSGLKIGEPTYSGNVINTTFSFLNNATYDLDMVVNGIVQNENDEVIANVTKKIQVNKGNYYFDTIELELMSYGEEFHVQFLFVDEENLIEYGPIEMSVGGI